MTLEYQLTESDYLTYQLFVSSKSESQRKKRFRSRIILPILYVLLGLVFAWINQDLFGGLIFIGIAILWFLFYPKYSSWRYKKHFQKHIREHYSNRINKPGKVAFEADTVLIKDVATEMKIKASELSTLIEIPHHLFIKLTNDTSIIIPKTVVDDLKELKNQIVELGAEYQDEMNWSWS